MSDIRILVVDADSGVREVIKERLTAEGYSIDEAADGISALKLFRRNEYSALIIDTALPELDGRSVCLQVRKVSDIPIIVVSGSAEEEDKLSCFEFGADDYITKPFSPLELAARTKVFLRRSRAENGRPEKLSYNGLYIDAGSHSVFIEDEPVLLTPKEYELLLFLSNNPNKAFSRNMLLNEVWGYDYVGSDRTVDTHIKSLRRRIKPCHKYILTVWGFGYKFEV